MHELGQAIVTGAYGAGNPFPVEGELCSIHGVSRSVLREAIKMLSAKGLLASRPRHGTWVQPDSAWNILDPDVLGWMMARKFEPALLVEFMQIRLAVEPMAARLAATSGTAEGIAGIGTALDRMYAAEMGKDDALDSDIAFHVAVLQASGNRFNVRLRDLVAAALRTSIRVSNQMKGVRLASVTDHRHVYDAIVARDPDRAAAAMHALIEEAYDLITDWIDRNGDGHTAADGWATDTKPRKAKRHR
jgi:DNA-binding FadR family transcriptional regulator